MIKNPHTSLLNMYHMMRTASEYASYFASGPCLPLIVRSVAEMHLARTGMDLFITSSRASRRLARVGFVPTMGALHAGHLGLVAAARNGGGLDGMPDFTVASVFVNPAQFAPHEDLGAYPRTWDADLTALEAANVSVIFAPTAASMYPPTAPFRSFVNPAGADDATPEGSARVGFFRGVATVVTKLFTAVRPTEAWFGQKDGVQCIIVRSLARDFNFPLSVRIAPTAREPDGLAMSSRNVYLSQAQRQGAGIIYTALREAVEIVDKSPEGKEAKETAKEAKEKAKAMAMASSTSSSQVDNATAERAAQAAAFGRSSSGSAIKLPISDALLTHVAAHVRQRILSEPSFTSVEYVAFSDALTGAPVGRLRDSTARGGAVMLSLVARAGTTRLLDNVILVGNHYDLGAAPGE